MAKRTRNTKNQNRKMAEVTYNEDNIRSLDWKEHIRLRPGMYIGKLGDGSAPDDGIYILVKEIFDNSIDEYVMGHGKHVDVKIEEWKSLRSRFWSWNSFGKSGGLCFQN